MSQPLVCDTSGVLAALDRADPDHAACHRSLSEHAGPLLLSPLVLAELDHLVRARLGVQAARVLANDVAIGAYELVPLTSGDVAECVLLDRHYADLGLGLANASLVVVAKRAGSRCLLSLDERHLRAIQPLQGGHFTLLPSDAR